MAKATSGDLLTLLQARFTAHMERHAGVDWKAVQARLEAQPRALKVLAAMEQTGGEPDVLGAPGRDGSIVFVDCSPESPAGRRSLCYDGAALESRKANKPAGSALGLADELGITLLDEAQYRELQQVGEFDLKTSSWILTTDPVRALGGALFCDRRFGQVFLYHNGAESYYAARGFRGRLVV